MYTQAFRYCIIMISLFKLNTFTILVLDRHHFTDLVSKELTLRSITDVYDFKLVRYCFGHV